METRPTIDPTLEIGDGSANQKLVGQQGGGKVIAHA
jgi:hypothetical protein